MAGGFTPDGRSDERHLWGMWVAQGVRLHGVGRALARAVIEWAAAGGANRVTLWLAEDNDAGAALYQRLGFIDTGRHQPLPSHPDTMERFLLLEIARPAPP
jgi:ribosomal-protein-alanine N-acetyltransferase